ncbi:MAG: transposase [Desulfobacterales bacterium]|jgi:transposase
MRKIAYLAIDVHARNCVLGDMDGNGKFHGNRSFITSENNIIKSLKAVKAKKKYLVIEAGPLSNWAAQTASACVTKVIICDPRENALIYKSSNKRDKVDTKKLCRLLRLGELKAVYRSENDQRAIFKAAVQHYLDLRDQLVALKHKIKAKYRQWGVIDVFGDSVYSTRGREKFLKKVDQGPIHYQLKRLYALLDQTAAVKEAAGKSMSSLGRSYPEINEFKKIPGMGPIGAHTFDAFIQTPHRFAKRSRLWKYCRLGVTDCSSDGKPLGYKRLDKSGVGELKALSHRAFMSAMKSDNEVKRFYLNSLQRTHDRKHARLNTQRKILSVMRSIWKKGQAYRAELFLDPSI